MAGSWHVGVPVLAVVGPLFVFTKANRGLRPYGGQLLPSDRGGQDVFPWANAVGVLLNVRALRCLSKGHPSRRALFTLYLLSRGLGQLVRPWAWAGSVRRLALPPPRPHGNVRRILVPVDPVLGVVDRVVPGPGLVLCRVRVLYHRPEEFPPGNRRGGLGPPGRAHLRANRRRVRVGPWPRGVLRVLGQFPPRRAPERDAGLGRSHGLYLRAGGPGELVARPRADAARLGAVADEFHPAGHQHPRGGPAVAQDLRPYRGDELQLAHVLRHARKAVVGAGLLRAELDRGGPPHGRYSKLHRGVHFFLVVLRRPNVVVRRLWFRPFPFHELCRDHLLVRGQDLAPHGRPHRVRPGAHAPGLDRVVFPCRPLGEPDRGHRLLQRRRLPPDRRVEFPLVDDFPAHDDDEYDDEQGNRRNENRRTEKAFAPFV